MSGTELPSKLFFKIGEVAQIVGVKPHVLRYWETEFPALRPMKTRGAHRVYKRRDVELAVLIRDLLYQQGYTVPGARKRLRELGRHRASSEADPQAKREVELRAELLAVRRELVDLRDRMDQLMDRGSDETPRATATVTGAVESSVPVRAFKRTTREG